MIKFSGQYDENHYYANDNKIVIQINKSNPIVYDQEYFDRYKSLEKTQMGFDITKGRFDLVRKYSQGKVLDTGIGCGAFLTMIGDEGFGYDINVQGVKWLEEKRKFLNPHESKTSHINCWTFWDVLEHLPDPSVSLGFIKSKDFLFISIPIFDNFENLKKNKHFKPNEHFYYFTNYGLIEYLEDMNFVFLEKDDLEIKLGRQDIQRYVFQKS